MIDWQALKVSRFKKFKVKFNLQEKMEEVLEIMQFRSEMQNIRINFDATFKKPEVMKTDFAKMIQYERMKSNLLAIDHEIDNHPLLKHVSNMEKNY